MGNQKDSNVGADARLPTPEAEGNGGQVPVRPRPRDVGAGLCTRPKQRKNTRLKEFNYSHPSCVYFLTTCARHLTNPFLENGLAEEIIKSLLFFREKKELLLFCYCLMPDHLHLVLSPSSKSGDVSKMFLK